MENPATWGPAEKIVQEVYVNWIESMEKPADERIAGLSLYRQITDALREAGLLKEDFSKVTRFEVINHTGRVLEAFPVPRFLVAYQVSVEPRLEDDSRTLKVFLKDA